MIFKVKARYVFAKLRNPMNAHEAFFKGVTEKSEATPGREQRSEGIPVTPLGFNWLKSPICCLVTNTR